MFLRICLKMVVTMVNGISLSSSPTQIDFSKYNKFYILPHFYINGGPLCKWEYHLRSKFIIFSEKT